ncbi:MAG: hypothetical protein JWP89_2051 [Schlesneria sp.]|nr:hypothetical protein [Schlesneria sp.]
MVTVTDTCFMTPRMRVAFGKKRRHSTPQVRGILLTPMPSLSMLKT